MKRAPIRWTDGHRFKSPYVPFAQSQKPGYLARRFTILCGPNWNKPQEKRPT